MMKRGSGILLHITSLPSPYGIGDFGYEAYRFADFLAKAKQRFWQILPLNPTDVALGNSPYSSCSAFAGNRLLISPDILVKEGFLSKSDIEHPPFPEEKVDFPAVTEYKDRILRTAYEKYRTGGGDGEFMRFCSENSRWLDDYALFIALKEHLRAAWCDWEKDVCERKKSAISAWEKKLEDRILMEKFFQYLFFRQWTLLKTYCNSKSIQIIGDMPIYVTYDSSDLWSNPGLFKLGADKKCLSVAGTPPDYFCATGQLWGNPIYNWDALKQNGYSWWIERTAHALKLYDLVRLDHFKGFVDYWEVPASEKTAINGKWVKTPGEDFFEALFRRFPYLPFIAEDLGVITADVRELRDRSGFPGMRIIQFAFRDDQTAELYKPHNYIRNCVGYTGTHDNNTLIGWLYGRNNNSTRTAVEVRRERKRALRYAGCEGKRKREVTWQFIRLLMMSVADTVIIPMQDILGLGEEARMNIPATCNGNWEWRFTKGQITSALIKKLSEITEVYGRD